MGDLNLNLESKYISFIPSESLFPLNLDANIYFTNIGHTVQNLWAILFGSCFLKWFKKDLQLFWWKASNQWHLEIIYSKDQKKWPFVPLHATCIFSSKKYFYNATVIHHFKSQNSNILWPFIAMLFKNKKCKLFKKQQNKKLPTSQEQYAKF